MLSRDQVLKMGFSSLGVNVQISEFARFYGVDRISIGNHVRIDDFCVLSAGGGGIAIGDYVHIAVHCCLFGGGGVTIEDFAGLSSRVSVYSVNEDYSGQSLTNPTVPVEYRKVQEAPVRIGRHAIIGSGSVILPGVVIGDGAAVGSLSLVKSDCQPFSVYFGSPARRIGDRQRALLDQERALLQSFQSQNNRKI